MAAVQLFGRSSHFIQRRRPLGVWARRAKGVDASGARDNKGGSGEVSRAAVVLGWLGAREQHVSKVMGAWQGVRAVDWALKAQPSLYALFSERARERELVGFARAVKEAGLAGDVHRRGRWVVHAMSNNGFLFLGSVMAAVNAAKRGEQIPGGEEMREEWRHMLEGVDGFVIDSAPSEITADIAARGTLSALLGEDAQGLGQRHPFLTALLRALIKPFRESPSRSKKIAWLLRGVWADELTRRVPVLLLSSSRDALIPAEDIAKFAADAREQGWEVEEEVWHDCRHVELYRTHPQDYVRSLNRFLNKHLE